MTTETQLVSDLMELGECASRLADDVGRLSAEQLADRLEHLRGTIAARLMWPDDWREPTRPLGERIVPRVEATRLPSVEKALALALTGAMSAGATQIRVELVY